MDKRVTLQDCAEAGYCGRGSLQAVREAGLDWRALTKGGIPLEEWETVEDAQFRRVAEIVRKRG